MALMSVSLAPLPPCPPDNDAPPLPPTAIPCTLGVTLTSPPVFTKNAETVPRDAAPPFPPAGSDNGLAPLPLAPPAPPVASAIAPTLLFSDPTFCSVTDAVAVPPLAPLPPAP